MKQCLDRIKPQVLAAIIALFVLGLSVIVFAPDYIGEVVGSVVTGIGILAMKVIEDSKYE